MAVSGRVRNVFLIYAGLISTWRRYRNCTKLVFVDRWSLYIGGLEKVWLYLSTLSAYHYLFFKALNFYCSHVCFPFLDHICRYEIFKRHLVRENNRFTPPQIIRTHREDFQRIIKCQILEIIPIFFVSFLLTWCLWDQRKRQNLGFQSLKCIRGSLYSWIFKIDRRFICNFRQACTCTSKTTLCRSKRTDMWWLSGIGIYFIWIFLTLKCSRSIIWCILWFLWLLSQKPASCRAK